MRLRWLLESVRHAVDERVDRLPVHGRDALRIAAQKLGKNAGDAARREDALLQFSGIRKPTTATQPVGDHPRVHRPYRSVVVRASPKPGRAGGLRSYSGARDQ